MLEKIYKKYYWFCILINIKKFVEICFNCVRIKTFKHKFYDLLQFLSVLKEFKQEWILNFITNLFLNVRRKTNYDNIFVVMNRYFKFARYIVAKKNWNAKNLTKIMIKQIFSIFEIFTNIIFNRDSLFLSNYWSTFCYYLQIRLKYFIAFYSQIDEQTKKQNQILKQYFRNYVNY